MASTQEITASLEKVHKALSASSVPKIDSIKFDWNGMHFSAKSDVFGTTAGMIKLDAKIGRLFFTIEDERLRTESLKKIHERNRVIDGTFKLEKDSSVSFSSKTTLDAKPLGGDFVKAVTMIMLESLDQFRALRAYLKAP